MMPTKETEIRKIEINGNVRQVEVLREEIDEREDGGQVTVLTVKFVGGSSMPHKLEVIGTRLKDDIPVCQIHFGRSHFDQKKNAN